jgi:hypothetical protein
VAWLVERGELRRDKPAWPGSAACFTWLGGMGVPEAPPNHGMGVPDVPNGGASDTPQLPLLSTPSGLPGPREGGEPVGCQMCQAAVELDEGLCRRCFAGWYGDERTFGESQA